jgi:putrescine transport system substrate-binding protein
LFFTRQKLFLLAILGSFLCSAKGPYAQQTISIYTSHGYLPAAVALKFEKETGIKILIDVFDNDDVLEAKLLSGAEGYDIVFPAAWPYGVRQITMGLYQEIDFKKIPNAQKIDPFFWKILEGDHQAQRFAVPYLWGIVGFAYNIDYVKRNLSQAPVDSWGMFFDPKIVKKMAPCGVTMLEDFTDVMIPAKLYLGIDPASETKEDLNKVIELLQKIRPYIKRFEISRSNDEIASGETCLAQHWLGEISASLAHLKSDKVRANIKSVIPKEGTVMWLDIMVIPKKAPHPDLAYKLINFLLRPDNIALVTNKTHFANPIKESLPFIKTEIRENKGIFPDKESLKRISIHKTFSPKYQKAATRALMRVQSGRLERKGG